MTKQEINNFEKTQAQLEGMYEEISALSKKNQNQTLNSFKLKMINSVIEDANALLGSDKPFDSFTQFDDNDLPTNSDAAVMLMQYLNCMEKLRSDNIAYDEINYRWNWKVGKTASDIPTRSPGKIKNK